jgi:DNA-binding transcriptional MocR family regulator
VIGVGKLLPDAKKKILVDRAANVQVLADISPIFVAGKSGRYNFFKATSNVKAQSLARGSLRLMTMISRAFRMES